LETSAWLCAKIARENNLGELVPGKNAFPHSKWVNTQCPGTLDWKWICAEANRINAELDLAKKKAEVQSTSGPTTVSTKKIEPKKVVEPKKISNVASQQKIEYYTIKQNDSYWKIASQLLKTKNAARIVKEVNRLKKLNKGTSLTAGKRLRIK
jgi:hypothetical protein